MTPYHFTARFRGLEMNYHGEIRPLGADVINAGRTTLTRKIKEWGLTPMTLYSSRFTIMTGKDSLFGEAKPAAQHRKVA